MGFKYKNAIELSHAEMVAMLKVFIDNPTQEYYNLDYYKGADGNRVVFIFEDNYLREFSPECECDYECDYEWDEE